MTRILGHEAQRKALARLVRSGKLPSTILFHGAPGIGKGLVAKELAKTLFCVGKGDPYGGCGRCHPCSLFESGNLPDYYFLDVADKEQWNVAAIRELLYSLNLKSFLGAARVVLMDNAEHLSVQASNALLKSLEEPRPDTFYILVTANPSRIPRTVLSRSQSFFFDSLTRDEVKLLLSEREESKASALPLDEQAVLADGSLAGISALLGAADEWSLVKRKLRLIASGDVPTGLEFSRELAKDRDALRFKLGLMRTFARHGMKSATKESERARWSVCLTNVIAAERMIFDRNLSAQLVLASTFLSLSARPDEYVIFPDDPLLVAKQTV